VSEDIRQYTFFSFLLKVGETVFFVRTLAVAQDFSENTTEAHSWAYTGNIPENIWRFILQPSTRLSRNPSRRPSQGLFSYLRALRPVDDSLVYPIQSIPDLVTPGRGPGGPLTSRPTIAPREATKAHSHVAQGSEHHFRDRPSLIASGGQLLVTIVDEVCSLQNWLWQ